MTEDLRPWQGRAAFFAFLLMTFAVAAFGQGEKRLLYDFNPEGISPDVRSGPASAYSFSNFDLLDLKKAHNNQPQPGSLFRTDYTQSGTIFLATYNGTSIKQFIDTGNTVYFVDSGYGNSTEGRQMWCTNGTPEGTIVISPSNVGIDDIFKVGTTVVAVSTGTALRKVYGVDNCIMSQIGEIGQGTTGLTVNSEYFFINGSGVLVRTDGTVSGTVTLTNEIHGQVTSVVETNSTVMFVSSKDGAFHLWKLEDGNPVLVKDFSESLAPRVFPGLDHIWLSFHKTSPEKEVVWKSDGSESRTVNTFEIPGSARIQVFDWIGLNEVFYVEPNWYGVNQNGYELLATGDVAISKTPHYALIKGTTMSYITDGTAANTSEVGSRIFYSKVLGGDSVLVMDNTDNARLLKLVVGNQMSTVATLSTGDADLNKGNVIKAANGAYFISLVERNRTNYQTNVTVWSSDLTAEGTIQNVAPQVVADAEIVLLGDGVPHLVTYQRYCCLRLFLGSHQVVIRNLNTELESLYTGLDGSFETRSPDFYGWQSLHNGWVSVQGTITNGEEAIVLIRPGGRPQSLFYQQLGDDLIFAPFTIPGGYKLWKTDGTAAGTAEFFDDGGKYVIRAPRLVHSRHGESHLYRMSSPEAGMEIFRFNKDGTHQVYDFHPGTASGPFVDDEVYFAPFSAGGSDYFSFTSPSTFSQASFVVYRAGPEIISAQSPKIRPASKVVKLTETKIALTVETQPVTTGTLEIRDIKTNAILQNVDTGIASMTSKGGRIYAGYYNSTIASIDSLGQKTPIIPAIAGCCNAFEFYEIGQNLYFTRNGGNLQGIDCETNTPITVLTGAFNQRIDLVSDVNDRLVFAYNRNELYSVKDGTSTSLIKLNLGFGFVRKYQFGSHLYYYFYDESDKLTIVKTDGTVENTSIVYEVGLSGCYYYYVRGIDALGGFYIQACSRLWYVDAISGEVSEIETGGENVTGAAYNEDLIFATASGKLWIYDVDGTPLGVGDIDELAAPVIYPNPVDDQFSISVDDYESIEVLNATGRSVFRGVNTGETISTSTWTEGLYFARIRLNGEVFNVRFLVRH